MSSPNFREEILFAGRLFCRFGNSSYICLAFDCVTNCLVMNNDTLEFVTFAIGSVAERLHKSPAEIYRLFKRSGVISGYLVPAYDVLHTFGRQYLVDDLLDFMREKGVELC